MDMPAETDGLGISSAAAGIQGICGNPCFLHEVTSANMPSEAVMRIGSIVLIVWLIIGAIKSSPAPLLQRF